MSVDVLAIGAHPDDVELGCAGTLAALRGQGHSFAIAHLTRGERASRGTARVRREEALEAGRVLGADEVVFLDLGDGGLRVDQDAEDQVIQIIRRFEPELLLGPPAADRHPDHERAHRLVRDAFYYSGLVKRGKGEAHRAATFLSYMLNDFFAPTVVVDVSATWQTKERALLAHKSQLHGPTAGVEGRAPSPGPETRVSSALFWQAIEGRARHFGALIGCAFGEAFWSPTPLAVRDLLSVCGAGLR